MTEGIGEAQPDSNTPLTGVRACTMPPPFFLSVGFRRIPAGAPAQCPPSGGCSGMPAGVTRVGGTFAMMSYTDLGRAPTAACPPNGHPAIDRLSAAARSCQ